MKAVLVIDLEDDVNLNDVEIRYAIQDMYGMPVKAEVDGCPLRPLPKRLLHEYEQVDDAYGYVEGWNACLDTITGDRNEI